MINVLLKGTLCTLIYINLVGLTCGQVTVLKPLSLHILDTTFGGNAPNVTCKLYRKGTSNNKFEFIATAITDADGRITQFLSTEDYTFGTYRLWFDIGNYYYDSHGVTTFFPEVEVTYENKDGSASHIPLTISPYAMGTYKGS